MKLSTQYEEGVGILTLGGQIELPNLPELSEGMEGLIEHGARFICVNCGDVSFVTSTGIGFFVATAQRLAAEGGEVVLSSLSKYMENAVRTLHLDIVLKSFEDDAAALAYLNRRANA